MRYDGNKNLLLMTNAPRGKVLITDDVHPLLIEGLEAAGYECLYQPHITNGQTLALIGDMAGLVINSKILVDRSMLDAGGRLRFVARLGSGMEIVDKDYARLKNVAVHSSPEGNRNAVAEHALGGLLALANKIIRADGEVRRKVWNREANRGFELAGRTIGIIGFGNTGAAFARKLSGMEMRILSFDKYAPPQPEWAGRGVETASLEQIQAEADVVSFHLPLTEETRYLCDARFLDGCKDGVIIINTSRGSVVQTRALVDALHSGKAGGACLDVFENEKPATFRPEETAIYEELYAFPNTVLTPHVAGWTVESKRRLSEVLLEKILKTEAGPTRPASGSLPHSPNSTFQAP